jgi:hypothetical protein
LRVLKICVLRQGILPFKQECIWQRWAKIQNKRLHDLCYVQHIRMMKSRNIMPIKRVVQIRNIRSKYSHSWREESLARPWRRWDQCKYSAWILMVQHSIQYEVLSDTLQSSNNISLHALINWTRSCKTHSHSKLCVCVARYLSPTIWLAHQAHIQED